MAAEAQLQKLNSFDARVNALWNSQKAMVAARRWKSGKRAGMMRAPAIQIEFTKAELREFLAVRVGLRVVRCGYCNAPIDIHSLTLDHAQPRSAGGRFSLENLVICCRDCNERKGELTAEGFRALLAFAETMHPYDRLVLLRRLKAAHHGATQRFFRPKSLADVEAVLG